MEFQTKVNNLDEQAITDTTKLMVECLALYRLEESGRLTGDMKTDFRLAQQEIKELMAAIKGSL